jgi:zinc transport system permease protein
LSVVTLIRVVGIILVLTLFTAPTAIASLFCKSLKSRMLLSVLIGNILCLTGLWMSYTLNIPSGAVIVILSTLFYFLVNLFVSFKEKMTKHKQNRELLSD